MKLEHAEDRIREALAPLRPKTRLDLLLAIMAPEPERAKLIGQLHREAPGSQLVELLIDLEEDRRIALIVADVLKESV